MRRTNIRVNPTGRKKQPVFRANRPPFTTLTPIGLSSIFRTIEYVFEKVNVPLSISEIYIDQNIADSPHVQAICSRLGLTSMVIPDGRILFKMINDADDPVEHAKTILYLTQNKGPFVRKCPGTREYTCCGYQILHIGTFCTMDCAYCILQSYFHPPVLSHYVNYQDMQVELDHLFSQETISRIGTGEFTDSLIWEKWTDLSPFLVSEFSRQTHAVLELKTKTTMIDRLAGLRHKGKTIMAWSLNSDRVIRNEERGTSSLSARLEAAAACASAGYPIAFHFDPMIIYEGCEEEYRDVIHQIFSQVSPAHVIWISLGTFRFMPGLKTIIENRFPDSRMVYGEFITGLDGKIRYFKPLRIHLFEKMVAWIREAAPDVLVYLCMEDDEVWEKAFGFKPMERGGLSRMLDERAALHCCLDGTIPTS